MLVGDIVFLASRILPIERGEHRVTLEEVDDVDPRDCTIATVPRRFAELGDLHAGIDRAVFDISPLLEWAERDERDGQETPEVPSDS